jgi:hypothetical protein
MLEPLADELSQRYGFAAVVGHTASLTGAASASATTPSGQATSTNLHVVRDR